jgi:multiple sugar transport system permease protein
MILLMAGLHDIPSSLYEASSIDGANKVQQFLYITIPSLSGVLKMVILLQIISSFKLFGQPWLMTGGGPGNSTTPLVQYIYETGFRDWDSGYASTLSYTLLFIMVVVALAYSKITNSKEV